MSGTDTNAIVFEYTVVAADDDDTGIWVGANPINLGSNVHIRDSDDNDADLTYAALGELSAHKLDGSQTPPAADAPSITRVEITSTPTSGQGTPKVYGNGEKIQITVTFDEAVDVTGDPHIEFVLGTSNVNAAYASGTGTTALVFEYTVLSTGRDHSGINIAADKVTLDSDDKIQDSDDNDADLSHAAVADDADHKVDGRLTPPSGAPDITRVEITSTPRSGTTTPKEYGNGEKIQVTVTFDEAVAVTGTPQVNISLGSATKAATYASGTGTTALVFEYTVQSSDSDGSGISIEPNAIGLDTGEKIRDSGDTEDANLTHEKLADDANHKVDGSLTPPAADAPSITRVEITSTPRSGTTTPKVYGNGEKIQVTVTFDEAVAVTGTPHVNIAIGGGTKAATYASGTGTTALVFEYAVQSSDTDGSGISIEPNAIGLDTGEKIRDSGDTEDADLTHAKLEDDANHKVDGSKTPPSDAVADITQVAVTSTPRSGTTPKKYGNGEKIEITVTFDEAVDVTSDPVLVLSLGNSGAATDRNAAYASGTGTMELVFAYTVQSTDEDNNGIWIGADKLTLDSDDKIRDSDGNDAVLTFDSLGTQSGHQVDGSLTPPSTDTTAPRVSSATVNGASLVITFNENLAAAASLANGAFTVKKTPSGAARRR